MKKNFYAVKAGRVPGIYRTWDEAEAQVKGFSGAKYHAFSTLDEAEKFIEEATDSPDLEKDNQEAETVIDINHVIEDNILSLKEDECVAAVDGSYNVEDEKAGFGVIIISYGNNRDTLYKAFTKNLGEEFISLRNVAAELEGVKEAINWAINSKKTKITIYYDYEGIEKWATGEWKANKDLTKRYVKFISDKTKLIDVKFVKVRAHSGIMLNEEADSLAKQSLLAKGHKSYSDGSVYFVGYASDDWKAIIDFINEENSKISDNGFKEITFDVEKIGDNREKIVIEYSGSKVVINCYPHNKSYAQGKQSVLFQKVIATAVECLSTKQSVVETLNSYYALSITQMAVEQRFEELLPHFAGNRSDKIYFNLLSAVYNTMLTGYMPDYTCLLLPVFRAYEFCLHRILGDKMGLDTADKNGKNKFSYFNKKDDETYTCSSSKIALLGKNQIIFLDELYTNYNRVRHQYAHWSSEDADSSVILDMKTARDYLQKGLTLMDRYYRNF